MTLRKAKIAKRTTKGSSNSSSRTEEQKEKARWQRILRVYGITKEQYVQLDLGYCPICLRVWNNTVRPNVDHDHVTGDVRGLLCTYCNRYRVGRFRDAELVYRVAAYLQLPRRGWIVPPKKKRKRKRRV